MTEHDDLRVGRQFAARSPWRCCYCDHVIARGQRVSEVFDGTFHGFAHDDCVIMRRAQKLLAERERESWGSPYRISEGQKKEHDAQVALSFLRQHGSTVWRSG